jgi:hypothetical protein
VLQTHVYQHELMCKSQNKRTAAYVYAS